MDDKKQQLQKMLATLDPDRLTKEEFVDAFEKAVEMWLALKKDLINEITTEAEKSRKQSSDENTTTRTSLEQSVDRKLNTFLTEASQKLNKALRESDLAVNFMRDKVRELRDGVDADERRVAEMVLEMIELPEQKEITPEEVRDMLETLEGDERLDIDAIRGLRELLEKTEKLAQSAATRVIASPRGQVKALDLNDYGPLDGVTKTFNLPNMWRLISVHSSSFPHSFVENTDYTWTPTSITFTDEIDADSTLAAGQTVTIIYAEN